VSEASREMTLAEWVDRLPKPHLARRQLAELEAALAEKDAQLSKGSQAAAHWYSEMAESVKRAEKERDEAMAELVTTQEALTRAYQVCAHRLEERDEAKATLMTYDEMFAALKRDRDEAWRAAGHKEALAASWREKCLEARAERDRFKHLVATYREHAESTAELRAERDRLKAERDFLRIGVRYAFHAVRASLSYKQEHNVARAEIALKLLLPDEAWRPVMGSFGFDLEQDVKDHLEQSVDKFIKEEDPVTIEEALLAAGYVKREFPEEGD
jgi:DNA repair exonuclease SbcCD ATPase subunit